MKTLLHEKFSAYISMDWADSKHDVRLQAADGGQCELSVIDHTPQAIERWALDLHKRFPGLIAVAVELSKGPLIAALLKYDFVRIFPINPATVAQYRKTFVRSGAKDDPTDARWILELLLKHPEKFPQLEQQSPAMRSLASLTEHRRTLVQERVKISNRLVSTLKEYYPLALELFHDHGTAVFCDFLIRWPTFEKIKRVQPERLQRFLNEHNVRRSRCNQARMDQIAKAMPLTEDRGIIEPMSLYTVVLAEQLKAMVNAIKRFDTQIESVAAALADYPIFQSLPGAGPQLAPRLMTALGEQRNRFENASAVQKYVGVAPVMERSGKTKIVRWRYQCSTFIRQTFVEWAAQSINKSAWARTYYDKQRAKGCSYQAALRALAFKWIRIVYRCWKTSTPYDEAAHIQNLKRRGSSLAEAFDEAKAV
ncbi:IS110 family transposase [Pseudomonas sp. W2Aug9]|uniref:IS110 family transposase n=1 Tax=Pseudomonas sp. W2Aug9 TaxID=1215242 RepID=UPI00200416F9|nr:IS110 family transposase [Pseudomonas sp. W2Aug9]MCK3826507.1 IS110 family transposase [Pseudomonas sp. W2Aug9]